jgi:tetratricopeptide (TPR) repeat protein
MNTRLTVSFLVAFCLCVSISPAYGQNPDLAKDLAEEGVTNEAKIEFIRVLHDPSKKAAYAEAHYYLGFLSFKEENYDRALLHWNQLVKEYPDSPYTDKAREQMKLAYQFLSRRQKLVSENIEINSLFENANLMTGQLLKVSVDTSYLSNGDLAIEWLEDIASKYPNSPDAPIALFREILIYYGWGKQGIGQYSSPEGYGFTFYEFYSKNKNQAQSYIARMIAVLDRLQKQYPDSPYKVPAAYLIAQAYWTVDDAKTNDNARTYWKMVMDLTQNDPASTYRRIAEKRLN